ncbi:rRNA maturation RNase YbeY [Campylobacter ureolyticus]|uniref:rRNA maturation RNase YbeY n=1 Tax=Campylobacter ureolyticus TaxID=827 RepID=UPI0022B4F74C|nr:rRNA maturation RNase YbeY [Campylobacter ureolyticus]MCZ6167627.1 rRNA maturation RNase YbeY [Campylobacter ureolyticus]
MISCDEKYPKILDLIASELTDAEIELIFLNSSQMHDLNKKERNIDKTTDVLSFPYTKMPDFPLGSVVINLDLADEKSKEFKHNLDDEIALLFTHGLLHILGYDHEIDNGEMRKMEEKIINKFNLPKSLIVRNS